MSENHREPEVPEEEVPVVECLDGLARITSEELAITKGNVSCTSYSRTFGYGKLRTSSRTT